jgi:hypothetical protein
MARTIRQHSKGAIAGADRRARPLTRVFASCRAGAPNPCRDSRKSERQAHARSSGVSSRHSSSRAGLTPLASSVAPRTPAHPLPTPHGSLEPSRVLLFRGVVSAVLRYRALGLIQSTSKDRAIVRNPDKDFSHRDGLRRPLLRRRSVLVVAEALLELHSL